MPAPALPGRPGDLWRYNTETKLGGKKIYKAGGDDWEEERSAAATSTKCKDSASHLEEINSFLGSLIMREGSHAKAGACGSGVCLGTTVPLTPSVPHANNEKVPLRLRGEMEERKKSGWKGKKYICSHVSV